MHVAISNENACGISARQAGKGLNTHGMGEFVGENVAEMFN